MKKAGRIIVPPFFCRRKTTVDIDFFVLFVDNIIMIKTFSVTNFKTFKSKVTFDFSKVSQFEFNKNCIDSGIVKKAIAYGENGSGKSAISFAIFDIVSNLSDNYSNKSAYINYLNVQSSEKYATFEYTFSFLGKELKYTYKKTDISLIVAETLELDGKIILNYNKDEGTEIFLNIIGTESLNKNIAQSNISYVKYIKSNTILPDTEENQVLKAFFDFVDHMLLFWCLEERSFVGYEVNDNQTLFDGIVKRGHFQDLVDFFKAAGIKDTIVHNNVDGKEEFYFQFPNKKKLPFKYASTGTHSLLLLFYWIQELKDTKKSPSFICIDEFDAFYHYELSRFVVNYLKNTNSQILLTTHNTSLMSNSLLRPDCYYLVYRDHIINLSSSTDRELREAHNIEKLYRAHEFES